MSTTVDILASLQERFPQATPRASLDHPALDVPPGELLALMRVLRDERGYDLLTDVTAVDWGESASPRFTAVYHLYSTATHDYLRIATPCAGDDAAPSVPSVTSLWAAADWHERETYDMFGIRFEGHPDLRRILMWEGYPYHPLRKEFPLAGIETEWPEPDVAAETRISVKPAPMAGGPFVASSGQVNLSEAEPRAKDESWDESNEKPAP
ncbi:NADH dehydrogenase [Cephaloticoccus primus]|uniref:NADH-quinone oxidoreductase subunit C n=1 Tax=Cephaloticoccus primus TaxID=1548207 RepID=A0A139SSG8_9BACT|nr:NADH-quinone oxidoreductase subunit C [Cephaloticoccus primus]KXU37442.1 NADH dehydrogenase [Cephaloticoccus primus]